MRGYDSLISIRIISRKIFQLLNDPTPLFRWNFAQILFCVLMLTHRLYKFF